MEPDPEQTIEHAIGDDIIAFEEVDHAIAGAISGILNRGDEFGRIVITKLKRDQRRIFSLLPFVRSNGLGNQRASLSPSRTSGSQGQKRLPRNS